MRVEHETCLWELAWARMGRCLHVCGRVCRFPSDMACARVSARDYLHGCGDMGLGVWRVGDGVADGAAPLSVGVEESSAEWEQGPG